MTTSRRPFLPPRWFIRSAWVVHRALARISGGRLGLGEPEGDKWGTLRLTTIGRKSGQPRAVLLGYYEDGPDLVTLAMNGWAAPEPAWWLNLQAHPDATVETSRGTRMVRGRAARGEERERLWSLISEHEQDLDAYAAMRPTETAVVILEPRS